MTANYRFMVEVQAECGREIYFLDKSGIPQIILGMETCLWGLGDFHQVETIALMENPGTPAADNDYLYIVRLERRPMWHPNEQEYAHFLSFGWTKTKPPS